MHHSRDSLPKEILDQFANETHTDAAFRQAFRRQMEHVQAAADEPLGATGRHPGGKLTATDEGEIRFAVANAEGKVILDFGTQVAWVGMSADQADELAKALHRHAKKARKS